MTIASHHTTPLKRQEEKPLFARARSGEKAAMDRIILSHYRFVVAVAKGFRGQGVDMPDLISEGLVGLHRAAQSFNPEREIRFMSYAVWWIRQSISRYIREDGALVQIPSNWYVKTRKATKETKQEQEERIALDESHLDAIRSMRTSPSMNAMVDAGMDFHHDGPDTDAAAEQRSDRGLVESLLESLDECDQQIMRARYGLDTGEGVELRGLGERFGISRERIRQRIERAEEQLKKISEHKFSRTSF